MSRKSYTLKDPDEVKKHTFLRGIRGYFSSARATKTTPAFITNNRAIRIVEKLSLSGKIVALLSFRKMHNAIIILNAPGEYSYISVYKACFLFFECVDKDRVVAEIVDDERYLRTELRDSDVVYISRLNTKKMIYYVRNHELINIFNYLSNNCSRFAADVLLAGCDIKPARFQHNRPTWQMPANTTELAKEIDLYLRKRRF